MILKIKGSNYVELLFKGLVYYPFLKKGWKFKILQELRKFPTVTGRLHSSPKSFDKTCQPSQRK